MAASMRAITETTVFLEKFSNVDLFFQGYYYFRCRMFYEIEEANLRIYAKPFCQYLTNDLEQKSHNSGKRSHSSQFQQFQRWGQALQQQPSMRPPSSFGGHQSPTTPTLVENEGTLNKTTQGSFAKPNKTPTKIFKNNLSKYNENKQQVQLNNAPKKNLKNETSTETSNKLIDSESQGRSEFDGMQGLVSGNKKGMAGADTIRAQHNIRRAETLLEELCFHSRIFYIRQSDEKVELGEVINFKTEFEANIDLSTLKEVEGARKCQDNIYGTKKFYLQIEMLFKEATNDEIENQENLKLSMNLEEAKTFQIVSTRKFQLRNGSRSGQFHFYPVTFDNGYFSSLSICVNSIMKEFKCTQTALLQDLRLAQSGVKSYIEAIDSKKAIKAYHDTIENESESLADLLISGKNYQMTKVQIQALQVVYINTISQVYKKSRSLYIKLLKQMKPGAYLEISGIQNRSNHAMVSPREHDELPAEIQAQDLYKLIMDDTTLQSSTTKKNNSILSLKKNLQQQSRVAITIKQSPKPAVMQSNSSLIQQKRPDAETPQLMTNITSQMISKRPSAASASFASIAKAERPANPNYMSKPNRAQSDKSLYDGNSDNSSSNNCDAPLSPKPDDNQVDVDDESIDGDIKTHSNSANSMNNLADSDYHHTTENVTYQRDRRQQEYQESNSKKNAEKINRTITAKDRSNDRKKAKKRLNFDQPEFNLLSPEDGVADNISNWNDSPVVQDVSYQMNKPKLIQNAHKLSTLQMFNQTELTYEEGLKSPQFVKSSIQSKYKDAATSIQNNKNKIGYRQSATTKNDKKKVSETIGGGILSDNRKKSCFNLSDILCISQKKTKQIQLASQSKIVKTQQQLHQENQEVNCDFTSNEFSDEDPLEDEQQSMSLCERYPSKIKYHQQNKTHSIITATSVSQRQSKQQINNEKQGKGKIRKQNLTSSVSVVDLGFRSQSPRQQVMMEHHQQIPKSRQKVMSPSRSERGISIASLPRASDPTKANFGFESQNKRIKGNKMIAQDMKSPKNDHQIVFERGQGVGLSKQFYQSSISQTMSVAVGDSSQSQAAAAADKSSYTLGSRHKTERRHRDSCKNLIAVPKNSQQRNNLQRSPSNQDMAVSSLQKALSPMSSRQVQVSRPQNATYQNQQHQSNNLLSKLIQEPTRGPTVRAAVPSFSGATKELDIAIKRSDNDGKKQLIINRAIQPLQSPSPYLQADESLGDINPKAARRLDSQINVLLNSNRELADNNKSKRLDMLNTILDRQQSGASNLNSSNLNSSLVNEERKAGVPKVSEEQHGKYGKKDINKKYNQLIMLNEEVNKKSKMPKNRSQIQIKIQTEEKMQRNTTYQKRNSKLSDLKRNNQKSGRNTQNFPTDNANEENENIEEEANDSSSITLDSMTRKIKQNLNHLGSNNPFQHEKVYKPGSKANKGAVSHRNTTQALQYNSSAKTNINKPGDYFSNLSMSIKTSRQQQKPYPSERATYKQKKKSPLRLISQVSQKTSGQQQHDHQSQSRLPHRSPSNQYRPKPAIFTKNSVIDTIGTERLHIRDSPTMATAMELHQQQLESTTMANNFTTKNSRLMNLQSDESISNKIHNTMYSSKKTIQSLKIGSAAAKQRGQRQNKKTAAITKRIQTGKHTTSTNKAALISQMMTVQRLKVVQQPLLIIPNGIEIQKVNAVMEFQLRKISNQIFRVWHKISRVLYLDPECMERVLRNKYQKNIVRYYNQMVVEYRYEEDLEENEFDVNLQKLSIMDSSIRQPNAILDYWKNEDERKIESDNDQMEENQYQKQQQQMFDEQLVGSALFQNQPAEEGIVNHGSKKAEYGGGAFGENLITTANRRKVNSVFEYENSSQGLKQGIKDRLQDRQQQICQENFVYTPNSRKMTLNNVYQRKKKQSMDGLMNVQNFRGRVDRRGRDNSVSTLGGKPISPRQIERSLVLARDRRQECSRVRSSQPVTSDKDGNKSGKRRSQKQNNLSMSSHTSSSESSDAESPRNKFMLIQKQNSKPKASKAMHVDMKHRTNYKFKLPLQEIVVHKTDKKSNVVQDFQPIIIEEVFYHKRKVEDRQNSINSITPTAVFERVRVLKANTQSNLNSFLSAGQSTQMAGYPKLTPQNKLMIKIDEHQSTRILTQKKIQANSKIIGRIETDESCDFFSDNLSETAAGALPQNTAQPLSQHSGKQQYHLFVFVHGFQASSLDMRQFRNHLQILLPKSMFLVSQANEKDTDSNIEVLGLKLAHEVKEYIVNYLSGFHLIDNRRVQVSMSKLTFIGHSLGGIIIREAIKHLKSFQKQFHGYISLGSPHLSYMYNSTSIVDAGMWLIKKFKQSESLKQLSMDDTKDKRQSYLYKLSQDDSLAGFKFVILVSSYQDSYAPHDSARIQMTSKVAGTTQADEKSKIYLEMVENILSSMNCQKLYRLDVNFKISDSSLASLIGRTAHILMIECKPFFLNLIHRYSEVFCE